MVLLFIEDNETSGIKMKKKDNAIIQDLISFLNQSPTAWHAVDEIKKKLENKGFIQLKEQDTWNIQPEKRYFTIRNGSSICAFITPSSAPIRTRLLASHTDSPSFKLKPQPEIRKHGSILFSVEVYGAPLLSSWLNRDLGIAGRVIYYDHQEQIKESLVRLDEYPMTIPQLAIHLDREVNEKGLILNKQEHLNVLAALESQIPADQSYLHLLLKDKINFKEIINFDLFVYPIAGARLLGYEEQMIAAYRIDSLASVNAALQAFLQNLEPLENEIKMIAFWDNEEIGSRTAQGAESPFIMQTLERILFGFNLNREDYFRLISQSVCVSIDLAHALHPNYADKHDAHHQLFLGKGVILKSNAQHRYASDARSSAPLQAIARKQEIALQRFVSRNDIPSGTTIGPIHASLTGMQTVDIGCSQLSMHSCRELMACQDHLHLCQLLQSILKESEFPSF
jgi:aspartyl aminopeptidase